MGAKDLAAWRRWHRRWVEPAERLNRVLSPSYGAWQRASQLVSRLSMAGWIRAGGVRPSFLHDCLLAASCRELGHTIVTFNRDDFELIARVEPSLRVAPPFP